MFKNLKISAFSTILSITSILISPLQLSAATAYENLYSSCCHDPCCDPCCPNSCEEECDRCNRGCDGGFRRNAWILVGAAVLGAAAGAGTAAAMNHHGKRGHVGPAGPIGLTGAQGPIGPVGPTGPTGDVGLAGPMGVPGSQGLTGAMGPKGPMGPMGPIGPMGPMGLAATPEPAEKVITQAPPPLALSAPAASATPAVALSNHPIDFTISIVLSLQALSGPIQPFVETPNGNVLFSNPFGNSLVDLGILQSRTITVPSPVVAGTYHAGVSIPPALLAATLLVSGMATSAIGGTTFLDFPASPINIGIAAAAFQEKASYHFEASVKP